MHENFSKYLSFANVAFQETLRNKTSLAASVFLMLILILTYNQLWLTIGRDQNDTGINNTYIWYLFFGELIILSAPKIERLIDTDIKNGTMAYYVNKPVSFFFMRFWESASTMSLHFLSLGITGCLLCVFLVPDTPFTFTQIPAIIVMVYLSSLINLLFFTAIGYAGLWINNIRLLAMTIQKLAFILGGAIFPLSIYPDWFVAVARWTPFYSVYYLTIRLSTEFSLSNLLIALGLNLIWCLIIGIFINFAYKLLQKKVDVYGG